MELDDVLTRVATEVAPFLGTGKVADYIPALARADPKRFAIAAATVAGECVGTGEMDRPFSLQSISKIFTLTLALERVDAALWLRVGREPSGNPFNSLVQLEHEHGIPRNPLINAGALVVTDVLVSQYGPDRALETIVDFVREAAQSERVCVNQEVAASERAWGYRNLALANFMRSFGNLKNDPEKVLDVYFSQCAIEMSCAELARAALYLANEGRDPSSGRVVVAPSRARRINAIMLTCGHYDASGDFAFRVGLPGKSGVGGGIVAIVPRRLAVAVWSPGLSEQGNSLVGTLALERFAALVGLSVF